MYCRNCGKQIEGDREYCEECENALNAQKREESVEQTPQVINVSENPNPIVENNPSNNTNAGNTTTSTVAQNTNAQNANTQNVQNTTVVTKSKSKIAGGLFGIFLGAFGVHNFYLGYTGKAVAQLLITLLSCGALSVVSAIWGFIEGVLILAGEIKTDADGKPLSE